MQLSKNLTLVEATKSQTAVRLGIDNQPNKEQLSKMIVTASKIFQRIRDYFGRPIGVSSFFRCPELNKAIGGSATSSHCNGEAIDIDADMFGGLTNTQIFNYIKDKLEFDQLIAEFKQGSEPAWIHASYREGNNRKQILIAMIVGGKTVYKPYSEKEYKDYYGQV